jgi:hypothetical protein
MWTTKTFIFQNFSREDLKEFVKRGGWGGADWGITFQWFFEKQYVGA